MEEEPSVFVAPVVEEPNPIELESSFLCTRLTFFMELASTKFSPMKHISRLSVECPPIVEDPNAQYNHEEAGTTPGSFVRYATQLGVGIHYYLFN